MSTDAASQSIFRKLKPDCVPLLGYSLLTPATVPHVLELLTRILGTLNETQASGYVLMPSLISYTFFPLSTILKRNESSRIPDQVLEKLLLVLAALHESWWWECDLAVWAQTFMLCGAIIGGLEGKGKGKDRDEETKQAAAQCLFSLLRQRTPISGSPRYTQGNARARLSEFQAHSRTPKFVPVLGQTVNSLLVTAESSHIPLQRLSLQILHILIVSYVPESLIPSILPGVVSGMNKVALGVSNKKGWTNGEIVAESLRVMQAVIIQSISDDVCVREGAIREVTELEDLVNIPQEADPPQTPSREASSYSTTRTPAWLRGTSSQLHIALNSLTPLMSHPTPSALSALTTFSSSVLTTTYLTLPQSQPLLLSFLLSLSNSSFSSVSKEAHSSLFRLLSPSSRVQPGLLQTLIQTTRDNLAALPRILPTHADAKVERIAGLIEAVCRLAYSGENATRGITTISVGIGKLLGPTGGIEKWGWTLLSVLEFANPPVTITQTSIAQLMLEDDLTATRLVPFPDLTLKHVSARTAYDALVRMFHSLGQASGDNCLFSVEWFTNVGLNGRGSRAVAALWCASRLLEGVGNISLNAAGSDVAPTERRSKRLIKLSRGLARSVSDLWEGDGEERTSEDPLSTAYDEERTLVEHTQGVIPIADTLKISKVLPAQTQMPSLQPMLHKVLSLQVLAVTAGILQAQFTPLLLYTLYPILHSIVSPESHLSSAALAALNFVTIHTSYASPSNLLLSNFDYALDSVSRRLTRRWLDVDATKVLAILIRLVGSDVVDKAGDVVEECFDRLDDFHGYDIIVEGLIEVLGEVIKVIEAEEQATRRDSVIPSTMSNLPNSSQRMKDFMQWFAHRNDPIFDEDTTDYGPAPREAWGSAGPAGTDEAHEDEEAAQELDRDDPPPTPTQALTKQIVSRSLYFLTHGSPVIRARILTLLSSSVPVLPESALLPSIHQAWPFILNRLSDREPFVVGAAASLVESLATHVGTFMYRRIWDDIWPRFHAILAKLDAADATSALARRGRGAVGTESAYTHSHRLYRSLLKTMTAAAKGVQAQDLSVWQVILAFRRFLHSQAHEELQACARDLYVATAANNEDAVWLALSSTTGYPDPAVAFLKERRWDIDNNVTIILNELSNS